MLYALVGQREWGLDKRLAFANELAGRKVYRQGFAGLGEEMKKTDMWGEKLERVPQQQEQQQQQ